MAWHFARRNTIIKRYVHFSWLVPHLQRPFSERDTRMIISIASGKGGTGKTLVATNLVLSLKNGEAVQLLDCDVEEPNSHVFLKPEIAGSQPVYIPVPTINKEKCTCCGTCAKVCAHHAIAVLGKQVLVFPQLCHGCGACSYLCLEKAISEEGRETGLVAWGNSDGVRFIHGKLAVGEPMAPPVIRKVKEYANNNGVVIIDVPPGTSCPVVEAIKGSDFCLLVTEPTPFGLNDLTLAVEMVKKLGIPCGVVLNRAGVGDCGVQEYCRKENIPILLTIPLDMEIARLYSRGIPLVEGLPKWRTSFRELFKKVKGLIDERSRSAER
jgi:MinD superfamily P-loop ATPase